MPQSKRERAMWRKLRAQGNGTPRVNKRRKRRRSKPKSSSSNIWNNNLYKLRICSREDGPFALEFRLINKTPLKGLYGDLTFKFSIKDVMENLTIEYIKSCSGIPFPIISYLFRDKKLNKALEVFLRREIKERTINELSFKFKELD